MRGENIESFRFPGPTHKTAIYGRTGDGKTVLATYILSLQSFDRMPWIVLDFKHDDLLSSLKRVERISLKDKVPREPGLYIANPLPHQQEELENFLWRIHAKRNTGLYVDEGYMVPKNSAAFDAILTQGRSLHIPVINLTQRPVWLSRFVTSQSDFHFLFPFNDDRDNDTVLQFMPREIRARIDAGDELPKYHSFWFDVERKTWNVIGPAPPPNEIAQRIEDRLRPTKTKL